MTQNTTLSIYYDGLCPLCAKEMQHYRKQKGAESLLFIDITTPDFDAEKEGLDPRRVHKVMHVKTSDGKIQCAVDAFIAIWQKLPRYQWLYRFAKQPFIRPFLDVGYYCFALVRPYLFRKNPGCEQSPYCDVKKLK